jgi:serine protease Do
MGKKLLAIAVVCSVLFASCTPKEVRLASRIQKSTVLVHILFSKGDKHGGALCSGVVVSPHEILLADHCVNPPEGINIDKVWVRDYKDHAQEATIEKKDQQDDLALLKIKHAEIPAKIALTQPPAGTTIWIVGMPLGITWAVTKGIISQTDIEINGFTATFFVTDATVLPGNSGGGAWNAKGELIGIVSMSTSSLGVLGAAGLGIVVDTDTINDFLFD